MKKLALRPLIKIKNSSKILDIGSGNNCLDVATHLIDLLHDSDVERGGKIEIPVDKSFSVGSIESIPFPDFHFDLVHAAHVLEHADEIGRAISELTRVSRCGYIETPQAVSEIGTLHPDSSRGWSFHRFMAWSFKDHSVLYLKPKDEISDRSCCECIWHSDFQRIMNIAPFQHLDAHLPYGGRMTRFNWKYSIPYEIWKPDQKGVTSGNICNCMFSAFAESITHYFRDPLQLRRRIRLKRTYPEIHAIFRHWEKSWPFR